MSDDLLTPVSEELLGTLIEQNDAAMVTGAYDRCVGDPQQAQIAIYLPDQPRGRSITTVPCRWQILLKLAGQIVDASHGIRVAIALSQDHAPGAYALTGQHSVRRILLGFTLGPVPASR